MEFGYLRELLLFLVIAGLLVPALQRARISPILGFLAIGLIVGPHGLATFADDYPWLANILITDVEGARTLSEIGVIFLLFMIGLELSFDRLLAMRHLVFGLGFAQVLVSAAVIALIAWTWDNSIEASIVLGGCLALSSTAIVIQLLTEQRRFGSPVGQSSFSILLAQDLAVVPVLFIATMIGTESGSLVTSLGIALLEAVVAIAVILGLGRIVIRPAFAFVGRLRSPEAFLAITLLVIAITSLGTHHAGLSAALGAFLVGLLLSETEYHHEIEHTIEPFKGMMLGLFFMSVGMGIDLAAVAANPFWIFASMFGLVAIKAAIILALMRLFRFPLSTSVESGLLLGQGGEFAFVIIAVAVAEAILPEDIAQFMLIVVSGTMLLTPFIAMVARRVGAWLQDPGETQLDAQAGELDGFVVICGYGRLGRLLAEMCDAQRTPHLALELDADIVARHRAEGIAIYHADASRPGILSQLGIEEAAAFAITMDDHAAAERVLKSAREVAPNLPIVMRARDPEHARELLDMGANNVIPEVLEAGMQMGQVMLQHLSVPQEAARDIVKGTRDRNRPVREKRADPEAHPPS